MVSQRLLDLRTSRSMLYVFSPVKCNRLSLFACMKSFTTNVLWFKIMANQILFAGKWCPFA
uniref:Ionotropic glutamate receptor C-terminal domain-containing protein n=1 Tax=Parascaris univalens TaxID=6257 RepID=A0A915C6X1_PARUN